MLFLALSFSLTENLGGIVFDRVEKPLDWLFEAWI